MESVRFWSRVGRWFKRSGRPMAYVEDVEPGVVAGGPGPELDPTGDVPTAVSNEAAHPATKFRLSRSASTLDRLEEEYARVVKLMDAVGRHLSDTAERSGRMTHSLDRLVESVSNVPRTSQQQLALLSQIGEAVSADAACTKRVEESLSQLPQIADAQRETMVSIGRQLDLSNSTTERVASTMGEVHDAVNKLAGAIDASTKVVEKLRWDSSAREDRIATILTEQTRRFSIFAWSVIGLSVVAAATALTALFLL